MQVENKISCTYYFVNLMSMLIYADLPFIVNENNIQYERGFQNLKGFAYILIHCSCQSVVTNYNIHINIGIANYSSYFINKTVISSLLYTLISDSTFRILSLTSYIVNSSEHASEATYYIGKQLYIYDNRVHQHCTAAATPHCI